MEPPEGPRRVFCTGVGDGTAYGESLEDSYAAAHPRLVQLLTAMSGSRADAEELAQEAFTCLSPELHVIVDRIRPQLDSLIDAAQPDPAAPARAIRHGLEALQGSCP